MEKSQNTEQKKVEEGTSLNFLKVDKLKQKSHALFCLLKTDDIIVELNKIPFKGSQKIFNQKLKEEDNKILTIYRKGSFFNIKVMGPLGIKLEESNLEDLDDLNKKTNDYLKSIESFDNFRDFEVFRGSKHKYNVLEVNEASLLASLLPFVWFIHHRLYVPLFLLGFTLILLGSIAWWLFLAAWIIITIYMSKSSMSLLRGYNLLNEMKIYMKLYAPGAKNVQEIVRNIDKKSNFIFPLVEPIDPEEKELQVEKEDPQALPT